MKLNKYKLMGLIGAAFIVAASVFAYASEWEHSYALALPIAAASFYVIAAAELLYAREQGAAGIIGYLQPAFYLIAALLTTAATMWYFIA